MRYFRGRGFALQPHQARNFEPGDKETPQTMKHTPKRIPLRKQSKLPIARLKKNEGVGEVVAKILDLGNISHLSSSLHCALVLSLLSKQYD